VPIINAAYPNLITRKKQGSFSKAVLYFKVGVKTDNEHVNSQLS
jgi:hypothetical protein